MTVHRFWPAAVLFDLDGTLADSFQGIALALDQALTEQRLPARGLAWTHRHVGRGAAVLIREAVGEAGAGELVETVARRYAAIYAATYLDRTPALPGAGRVLAAVAARTGGRVGVVSNKAEALCRRWLEHHELARHVAVVAGPESYGARKPDPRALLPVLAALDAEPSEALLVGDMTVDAEAGRNAGIAMVGVRGPASEPGELVAAGAAAELAGLDELLPWLAAHGSGWREVPG